MKKILITALFGLYITSSFAQSDVDALRYSLTPPLGSTARSMSLGGASGALGADQSTVLTNPAGLAQFKSNSFNISVGTNSLKNKSTYLEGNTTTSNLFLPEFNSINLTTTNRKLMKGNPVKTGWVNTNWQFGYNKVADFDRNISYKANNGSNSFTDYIADYVKGLDVADLASNDEQQQQGYYYFENMFWEAFLIDSLNNRNYYAVYDPFAGPIGQKGKIITRGGIGEFNAAVAGNFEHKVYLGAGVNLSTLNYTEKNTFSETDNPITTDNWRSYDFTRNLETDGIGLSARLGVVFRLNDNLRIGGTLHTPTKFWLTDDYKDELYVVYDDGYVEDMKTIDKSYSYTITTPAKYGLQAAYIFGKKGLITAEVESLDYSTMNIVSDDDLFEVSNEHIANAYTNSINIKLGGECVMNSFRWRAGFAHIGSPFESGNGYSRKIISSGFGIHEKRWAFDFGMSKDVTTDEYVPYTVAGASPTSVNNLTGTRVMLTLTSKF